jgi:cellulose synthase/poly-beta-1,6-N-acetylglucosamine synthase-like glycosyltransferase
MISFIIPWNDTKDSYRLKSFNLIKNYVKSSNDCELIVGYDYEQSMNRSRARNNAFLQAKGEFLVVLDADTWVSMDAILNAVQLVKDKNTWVIPYQNYYNLTKEFTEKIFISKDLSICEYEESLEFDFKILSWD